jgi:uncharacterized protein (DUF305 family)
MRAWLIGPWLLLLVACSSVGVPRPTPTPLREPTASPKQNAFDQQFLDMMVGHHQASLEMARIATERAQHPELKQIADAIIAQQPAEIDDMQQWRADWFGSPSTPPLDRVPTLDVSVTANNQPITANLATQIDALKSAPEPFDKAFIDALLPIHQREVDAARTAILQGGHQEVLDLAGEILAAELHEIEQLQGWRSEWFGSP